MNVTPVVFADEVTTGEQGMATGRWLSAAMALSVLRMDLAVLLTTILSEGGHDAVAAELMAILGKHFGEGVYDD